jgi:hypothetical protein
MNATDKQKKMIHSLCRKNGMQEEERREMLRGNFGVNSTRELSRHQASELIGFLQGSVIPCEAETELDKWRKRLIASIGGMLRILHREKPGREENMAFIKAIACRAGGYKRFNAIPRARLQSLYNAFNNSQDDLKGARITIDQMVNELSLMN